MSCVVHVENAPEERRILFGMFGGKDREMRIREAYHVKDSSCSTGLAAIIEYEKMSSVSTAISAWNDRSHYTNGPLLKVQEVNLEFYCSILQKLHEKDIAIQELQQEYDKLRKTLQAELPKGPRAMTSPKPVKKISNSRNKDSTRQTSELVHPPFTHNSLPTSFVSQSTNAETHITLDEMGPRHEIALEDLFPEMLAAFERVQGIMESGHEDASHDVGRPLRKIVVKDVNQGSVFLRRGDEQKVVSSLSEENRHKKRKVHEEPQTKIYYTSNNVRIGKRALSSVLPFSNNPNPYTPTRKLSHPTPSPSTTWQTRTPIHAHPSLAIQKSLGGSPIKGSDVGTVSAGEALLKGYIEGQAKDKQQDIRWRALGYHRSLA